MSGVFIKAKSMIFRPSILHPYSLNEVRKQLLFIHIPKNAGTSLLKAMNGVSRPRVHEPWEAYQTKFPSLFEKSFKFCVVRHPFDRFVSTVNYCLAGGNQRNRDKVLTNEVSEYFENGTLLHSETISYLSNRYNIFRPQSYFVCNQHGRVMVDKMYRLNNLSSLSNDLKKIGVQYDHKSVVNKSEKRVSFLPEELEVLRDVYGVDFELYAKV